MNKNQYVTRSLCVFVWSMYRLVCLAIASSRVNGHCRPEGAAGQVSNGYKVLALATAIIAEDDCI